MNEPRTVLIAEDDAILRTALMHKLEAAGYTVLTAENGNEGLKCFIDKQPDALVIDIMMPEMDGATMLEEIRTLPEGKDVPAVILTNADDLGYVARTTNSDAEDYIIKSDQSLDEVVTLIDRKVRNASEA